MANNDETNGKVINISERILIGIFAAIGYVYVFANELGYTSYFNLPSNYISISLERILLNSIVMILFGYLLLLFLISPKLLVGSKRRFRIPSGTPKVIGSKEERISIEILKNKRYAEEIASNYTGFIIGSGAIIMVLFFYSQIAETNNAATVYTVVIISWTLISLFLSIFMLWKLRVQRNDEDKTNKEIVISRIFRIVTSLPEMLTNSKILRSIFTPVIESLTNSKIEISIFGYKTQLKSKDIIVIIILLICLLFSSYYFGLYSAKNDEDYYVVNTNPEMVVLRSYGETLISAPFDRETNIVEMKFTPIEIMEDVNLFTTYEHLGRLRPAEIIVPVEEVEEIKEEHEPPEQTP